METWLIFAILSLIFAGLYNFMYKIVAVNNYNTLFINKASYLILLVLSIIFFLFNVKYYSFGNIGFGFLLLTFLFNKKNNHKHKKEGSIKLSIITGLLYFGSFYCFIRALEGNLAIVFTINSFSILIPIILSIFFYKEHFNLRKFIVIVLSIISILLFI